MTRKIAADLYPNSPLVEVIFEIRFAGDPAIECKRDIFFKLIRKDYPKLYVPPFNPQSHVGLEPYRFVTEDETAGVMIALNRFACYTKKYPGFDAFKKEVLHLVRSFRKAYPGINALNRIGFRYVNLIPFTREGGCVPLDRLLKVRVETPCDTPERFKNISIGFVAAVKNGSITVRIENIQSAGGSGEALRFDTDFAKEGKLGIGNMIEYLNASHSYSRRLFEDMITDEFRKYLNGETI